MVTEPLRYIAVDREALRGLLFDDGPLSDLVLSTFIARREALESVEGVGIEIVGPRSSEPTMEMLAFVRANRLPFSWQDADPETGAEPPARAPPGGVGCSIPRAARGCSRALGDRPRARSAGGGRSARRRRRPGRSRRRGLWRIRRARHARRRGHGARRSGGASRRIENYLGFPAGITRQRAHQPCGQSGAQVRRPAATPYRAIALEPGDGRHIVRLEERPRDRRRVPWCSRPAPSTGGSGRPPRRVRGPERLLRRRAARGAALRRLPGRASSAAGTPPARPRSGSRAAARS